MTISLRDLDQATLECRDERCHWERERKYDERLPLWGTYRWDICTNCGNWRCRIQASDGSITPNTTTYEYTDAYEAAKKFTREDCRKELDRRAKANAKKTTVIRGQKGERHLRAVG